MTSSIYPAKEFFKFLVSLPLYLKNKFFNHNFFHSQIFLNFFITKDRAYFFTYIARDSTSNSFSVYRYKRRAGLY